jgi:NADH-quinone oxidoreductase subunit N
MTQLDLLSLLPHMVLLVWASLLLLVTAFLPKEKQRFVPILAALGIAVSLGLALAQSPYKQTGFHGMVVLDGFSSFLVVLILVTGLLSIAMAYDYLKRLDIERGEYYCLLLMSMSGMMLMASAADLIIVFLALELLSIPLYILSGFSAPRAESEEAALKYFILGAFASGFVLYGIALIYAATGQSSISGIVAAIDAKNANHLLILAGAGLLTVGFGFKVAAVPFHMWTPDVYQGAPSPVSGFMSVGAKAAGFAALVRVFILAFPSLGSVMTPIFWTLAALTMFIGNILAVSQSNIKRMLAYSSIAHAGYMLMAFVAFGDGKVSGNAAGSILFYLLAYAFTSLGAWAVVTALEKADGSGLEISDYAGLGKKYPLLAAGMAIFMFSFTGVPPALGFWGKFYLFRTSIEGGFTSLAIIGLLTSLFSAFYYLRVVVMMYMKNGEPAASRELWVTVVVLICAAAVLAIGLFPGPVFNWAVQAGQLLL